MHCWLHVQARLGAACLLPALPARRLMSTAPAATYYSLQMMAVAALTWPKLQDWYCKQVARFK